MTVMPNNKFGQYILSTNYYTIFEYYLTVAVSSFFLTKNFDYPLSLINQIKPKRILIKTEKNKQLYIFISTLALQETDGNKARIYLWAGKASPLSSILKFSLVVKQTS